MRPGPLLAGLSLPRDLELLRDRAGEASRRGEDLAPLYAELAETAPVALIDLTLGPKAMKEAAAVRAALAHAEALERHSPGMAPYRRLASLSPEAALDVLTVAVSRHAAASWLITFADKIEARPGAMQLAANRGASPYAALCWAHAAAGHFPALVAEASSGQVEPAAALLAAGRDHDAVEAAARAIEAKADAPIVPWLAAVAGPQIEDLLLRLVPRLRSAEAARALHQHLTPFPKARGVLGAALRGMR